MATFTRALMASSMASGPSGQGLDRRTIRRAPLIHQSGSAAKIEADDERGLSGR